MRSPIGRNYVRDRSPITSRVRKYMKSNVDKNMCKILDWNRLKKHNGYSCQFSFLFGSIKLLSVKLSACIKSVVLHVVVTLVFRSFSFLDRKQLANRARSMDLCSTANRYPHSSCSNVLCW